VIYLGLRNTPETVAAVTVHEDADVVGLSILSGSHKHLVTETRAALDKVGATSVPILVGGVFPRQDVEELLKSGAAEVFGPGTTLADIVRAVPHAIEVVNNNRHQTRDE
jgi:methylmalonyl-CoA mutase C-terminal domain/subunit